MSDQKPKKGKDPEGSENPDIDSLDTDGVAELLLSELGDTDLQADAETLDLDALQEELDAEVVETASSRRAGKNKKELDALEYEALESVFQKKSQQEGEGEEVLAPVSVEVSPDRLTAVVSAIYPDTRYDDIMHLLQEAGIVFGIDSEALREAIYRADLQKEIQKRTVMAEGTPPKGGGVRLEWHLSPQLVEEIEEASAAPSGPERSSKGLEEILAGTDIAYIEAWDTPVQAVVPGQVLCSRVRMGESGMDVFGQEVFPDAEDEVEPKIGANVEVLDDGEQYAAEIYGYVIVEDGGIAVRSPLWISADETRVSFVNLPHFGEKVVPTAEDLHTLLDMELVEYGIDKKEIHQLCSGLRDGSKMPRMTPIAQGERPVPGEDARIKLAFNPEKVTGLKNIWNLLHLPSLEQIRELENMSVLPVSPGQILATKVPAQEGTPGMNVFGDELAPEDEEDMNFELGENVELSEDGLQCVSSIYGYVGVLDEAITALSPIWMSPNRLEAHFIYLPPGDKKRSPTVKEIHHLLDLCGVSVGVQKERVEELCRHLEAGTFDHTDFLIAQGRHPIHGKDAQVAFTFDVEKKPGKILEDGSIDFKERDPIPKVEVDHLIGEKLPRTGGVAGIDLIGEEIPAEDGQDFLVSTKNVRQSEEEGRIKFYSDIEGGVTFQKDKRKSRGSKVQKMTLSVHKLYEVPGDVDYETGNIDFSGDVYIKGSVRANFSVKASGSVIIAGQVELGASVLAGADVSVGKGVVGKETRVVAGGDVMAKFIQDAQVRARGDVTIGVYMFNASVRCGGEVTVDGRGTRKGSKVLVGGLIWAASGVTAKSLGARYTATTKLVAGIDPNLFKQLADAHKRTDVCNTHIVRIMNTLNVNTLDPEQLRQAIRGARTDSQRALAVDCIKKLNALMKIQAQTQEGKKELDAQMEELAQQAQIRISGTTFAGVVIRIGDEQMTVMEDTGKAHFFLDLDDEEGEDVARLKCISG